MNDWIGWAFRHPNAADNNEGGRGIISRGYYDEIFSNYFKHFPTSKFFLIDSYYAFENEQRLCDEISNELNLPKRSISYQRSGKGEHKEELTDDNYRRVEDFYSEHEKKFRKMVMNNKNVKTFPDEFFLQKHYLDKII